MANDPLRPTDEEEEDAPITPTEDDGGDSNSDAPGEAPARIAPSRASQSSVGGLPDAPDLETRRAALKLRLGVAPTDRELGRIAERQRLEGGGGVTRGGEGIDAPDRATRIAAMKAQVGIRPTDKEINRIAERQRIEGQQSGGLPADRSISTLLEGSVLDPNGTRREQEMAARRAEVERRRQASAAARGERDTMNSEFLADAKASGKRYYTDPATKLLTPMVDESGRQMYHTSPWAPSVHPQTGLPALESRDQYGQRQFKRPKLSMGVDPLDENLYADMGDGESQPYMKGADAINDPDVSLARLGLAHQTRRNSELRRQARAGPLAEAANTKLEMDRARGEIETLKAESQQLSAQAAAISPDVAGQTQGGILGFGASPTPAARAAQAKQQELDAAMAANGQRLHELETLTKPGGELHQRQTMAKMNLDIVGPTHVRDEHFDKEQEIKARLEHDGIAPEDDPTYQANHAELVAADAAVKSATEFRDRWTDLMAQKKTAAGPAPTMTPMQLIAIDKKRREYEETLASGGDNLSPELKAGIQGKIDSLGQKFTEEFGRQPVGLQKRISDITREPTLGEEAKNFVGRVGEGIGSATVDTGESILRNTGKLLQMVSPAGTTDEFQGGVKNFAEAMRQEASAWGLSGAPAEVAQKLSKKFSGSVGQGIGSTIAFIGPTSIVGGIGKVAGLGDAAIARLMTATVAATGAASEGNSFRREAESHLQPELESGKISREEYDRSLGLAEVVGNVAGSTEAFTGISRMTRRIGEGPVGKSFLRKFFDLVGADGADSAVRWLRGPGAKAAMDVASEVLEESGQEYLQNRAENIYASNTFDPTRPAGFLDDTDASDAAGSAAISTLIVSSLTQALHLPKLTRRYKELGDAVKRGAAATGKEAATPAASGLDAALKDSLGGDEEPPAAEPAPTVPAPTVAPGGEVLPAKPTQPGDQNAKLPNAPAPEGQVETPVPGGVAEAGGGGESGVRTEGDDVGGGIEGEPPAQAQGPAPVREAVAPPAAGATKPAARGARTPTIARGTNSPLRFVQTALESSSAHGKPEGVQLRSVLMDFTRRIHEAAPEAFKDMETHVLDDKAWKADEHLRSQTPDSAAAYDPETNTLYLNSNKLTGENLASAVVHEAGHFAEKFYLGEDFTQKEWEKLTPAQREGAIQQYKPQPNRPISEQKYDKNDRRARSEWVAMQFARVARGETEGMSERMKAGLTKVLEAIRSVVRKWVGDPKLTTADLDAKIVKMLGYDREAGGETKPAPAPPKAPVPAPAPASKPAATKKTSKALDDLAHELFGAPPEGKTYSAKFDPAKHEAAVKFVGTLVHEHPEVRSRAALAAFLHENYPKAKPYSESIMRMLGGFADVDEAGKFEDHYAALEKPADTPTAPADPKQEIRDLISSEDSHAKKSVQMRQMAERRGITTKAMQEAVEADLVRMVNEFANDKALTSRQLFERAVDLYNRQPLFSARTSTSVENQAYSTPAPLAVALKNMTGVDAKTTMYEPTGGNGMLMIGANLKASAANELNPERAAALKALGVGTVTENDALKFVPKEKFDVIHTNPPFGSIDNVNYDGYGIRRLEHLIALKSLEAMKDNGAASIIIGANREEGPTAKGAQWIFENYLYGHYNVVDNFEVSGDLYGNQGAKWPVRVITLAGRKATPKMGDFAPKTVDRLTGWDGVWARSEKAKHEIEILRSRMGAGERPGASDRPGAGGVSTQNPGAVSPQGSGTAGAAGPRGERGGTGGRESANPSQSPRGGANVAPAGTNVAPAGTADKPGVAGKPPVRVEAGNQGRTGSEANAPGGSERTGGATQPRKLSGADSLTEKSVPYVPRSEGTPFNTLTPTNIGNGTHRALDELKARVGPIDDFVADRINLPVGTLREVMAADQIDGVALAIDQIEQGGAVIIGDQTGIGKGRQAAALIRYAKTQGKIPVFFTKDPKLFSDMFGDLKDISTKVAPFIFGDSVKASIVNQDGDVVVKAPSSDRQKKLMAQVEEEGIEKAGFDSVFATYSQVNTRNARQLFFEELAKKNDTILILDEAHEAAGDGETSMQAAFMQGGTVERGKGANKEKIAVPGLLRAAGTKKGRGGVTYLSATYAKRPDNMPLYSRTDLSKAAQDFGDVVAAMKAGGVALQQALSEALAARGQYIRRERDFSGVKYAMKTVGEENKKAIAKQVDDATDVLSRIVDFSKRIREAVAASNEGGASTAMTEAQSDMTDFASIVHNQVSQLLLAAKADDVVKEALAAVKAGEKPVITMMNTMESFLDHYVEDHDIKQGAAMKLTWQELLAHALERTLRMTTKMPNGDTVISTVNPADVGMGQHFQDVLEAIKETDIKFPVSPIDYILQKLAAAGVKVGELTGRQSGIKYSDFEGGQGTYQNFKPASKNALVNGFNGGGLDGLLLNASGSTGLSIHASPKFKDSRKRHMIIAQPALDINTFVQTLGRILRTGMKEGGAEYTHLALPLQAEMRPAAVTNKKMKSLNANTTAEAEGGLNVQAVDMLNKYGDKIVAEYLDADPGLQAQLDLEVEKDKDDVPIGKPDLARKFMGRLSLLPDAVQKEIYSHIIPAYNEHIEQLRATGDYDLDIVVHDDWDGVRTSDMQLKPGTDESNILTSSVRAQQWDITDTRKVPTGEDMKREFEKNTGGAEKFHAEWADFQAKVRERQQKRLERAEAELAKVREAEAKGEKVGVLAVGAQADVNNARADMARWSDTENTFNRIFSMLGEAVNIGDEATHENHEGMLIGVKFPKVSEDGVMRVSPSRFQFRYLVNEPGGRMFISGAQFVRRNYIQTPASQRVSDFKGDRGDSRYKRWVVTGNPVAAYRATGGQGKMVRFKTHGGDVVTGLLMRNNWNVSKLAADPRFSFANGKAAARFLLDQPRYGGRQVAIVSDNTSGGQARIARGNNGFVLTVPSSSAGRDFFLDPKLRNVLGDFTKVGSRMTVSVGEDDLRSVTKRIGEITSQQMRAEGTGNDIMQMVNRANSGTTLGSPTEEPAGPLGTPSVISRVATAASDLGKEATTIPSLTGFNKVLNRWTGNRQIGIMKTVAAVKEIMKAVPNKLDRVGIANWIDAGGDDAKLKAWAAAAKTKTLRDGYLAALKLTPAQLAVADKVKDWYKAQFNRAVAGGVIKEKSFLDDYVTHLVKRPFAAGGLGSAFGAKIAAKFRYALMRTFPNFHELEQAGFDVRTKDIAEIMAAYGTHLTNAIETRRLSKALLSEKNDKGESLGKLILGKLSDEEAGKANFVTDPTMAKEGDIAYKAVAHPAFRGWGWRGTSAETGKDVLMQGEIGVHPDIHAQLENAIGRSVIRQWYDSPGAPLVNLAKVAVKAFDTSQSALKGTMLGGISTFHAVHEYKRALGNRVVANPIITQDINANDPRTQRMLRAGVMLSGDYDAQNLFSEGLGGRSLVDKIPGVGQISRAVSDYTFHKLIPSLKWHAFNAVYERNLKTFADTIKAGEATADDVAYLTAKQVNARFGHLNLADLNRDPTLQHILGWAALAPDFLESNLRNYGQAVKGATGAKTGREPVKAFVATAATLWILARILNQLGDDDPHNEEPFGVVHKNRRYVMRNEAEDLWRMFTETGKFISGRLNPGLQTVDQLRTGLNWRGEKVTTGDTLKEFLTKFIPISGRALPGPRQVVESTATGHARTVTPFEEFLSSQGVQVSRHSPANAAYQLAKKFQAHEGVKPDTATYPVSRYQQVRYALEDADTKRAREEAEKLISEARAKKPVGFDRAAAIKKLGEGFHESLFHPFTGTKESDARFLKSLSPEDRKKVVAAERLREITWRRFAGLYGLPASHSN